MPLDGLADIDPGCFKRFAGCHAARKVRNVRSPVVLSLLEQNRMLGSHFFFSNPAAFRIDFRVPIGTSSPGCPRIVTTFGFEE